jgi:protein DJ-1
MEIEPMKRALVLLAPGAEEMEVVIVTDVLRRAGLEVTLAGVAGNDPVVCSRNVRIVPDCVLEQAIGPVDLVVLPGGAQGAELLAASERVHHLLQKQDQAGKWIGAICAAPIALVAAGVGKGRAMTSHPSVREKIAAFGRYKDDRVVRDGHLVTSRGPGTALEFALALVEQLLGREAMRRVAEPMML